MRDAEKLMATSMFKWKPDFESAATEYQKAATCFKNAKAHEQAKEAFLKEADCSYKLKYLISAAQTLENAASMAKQMKRYEEAGEIYQRASQVYLENGSGDKAAELLAKAGETLKEVNMDKSGEYYADACELYVTEGKEQMGQETFRLAISIHLKLKKYFEALAILKKQTQAYQKVDNKSMLWKCFLSSIIIVLAMGDPVEANKQYQSFGAVEGFVATEEARLAAELLDAYEQGDQDKLTAVASKQHISFLEAEVARLAKSLKAVGGGDDNPLL